MGKPLNLLNKSNVILSLNKICHKQQISTSENTTATKLEKYILNPTQTSL